MSDSRRTTSYRLTLPGCLETKKFGRTIKEYGKIDSTNKEASILAEEGLPEGALIIASEQEKGRGRLDRRWYSPPGGLWFSVVLKPDTKRVAPLTVIMGGSISNSIEKYTGLKTFFHWPNDIYHNEKKMGGILLESKFSGNSLKHVIAGVGINANFPVNELPESGLVNPAFTILDALGKPVNLPKLLAHILLGMEEDYHRFLKEGPEPLIKHYRKRCMTPSRRIRLIGPHGGSDADGTAVELTPDGGLKIKFDSGDTGVVYHAERILLLRD